MKTKIQNAILTHELQKNDIITILSDDTYNDALFKAADEVRAKYIGNRVHLRGLIEFSNLCKNNCLYCGLRKDNNNIERYYLDIDKIIELAKNAVAIGYKTVVLQSGEDFAYSLENMQKLICELKKLDVAITLSLGEKSYEEYKAYKDAGADRYLIRIETTDRNLYKKMHPEMDIDNRFKCLEYIKELGYEVGTGCLVGLPEQTIESLADDILFFKKIEADMIGIGPFIPNPDTPLKDCAGGTFTQSLKLMALIRILMPDINIPATTAMETLHPEGRLIALQCGANVIMPNITDYLYSKNYNLYPDKFYMNGSIQDTRTAITEKIKSIGRIISDDYGFRKNTKG